MDKKVKTISQEKTLHEEDKRGKKVKMISPEKMLFGRWISLPSKKAEMISQELVTWVIYALIAAGVIFAVRAVFMKLA